MQVLDFVPLTPQAETDSLMTVDQFKALRKYLKNHGISACKTSEGYTNTVYFLVNQRILNIKDNIRRLCELGADENESDILDITVSEWKEARSKHYYLPREEEKNVWVDELIYWATDGEDIPGWTSNKFWERYREEDDLRVWYMQGKEMPEGYNPPWNYPEGKPSPFSDIHRTLKSSVYEPA